MKLMIASDLHGSVYFCEHLLEAYRREGAGKLLLLGDILYHGPRNDLPGRYDAKQTAALLNSFSENLLCVRGNCDSEADQTMLNFPITAEYAFLLIDGRTMYMQHGHHEAVLPKPGDIVLRGHTHIPGRDDRGGVMHLNPGSVSLPKGGSLNSFMTYSEGMFKWKTLAGDIFDQLTFAPK